MVSQAHLPAATLTTDKQTRIRVELDNVEYNMAFQKRAAILGGFCIRREEDIVAAAEH
jgi:hypothetical protein